MRPALYVKITRLASVSSKVETPVLHLEQCVVQ